MGYVIDTGTRIPGAALKAAGVSCVVRYVSSIPGPKIITTEEYADLQANGLDVLLVYEDRITDMGTGLDAGIKHGEVAVYEATQVGYEQGKAIYFASDTNAVLANTRDTMCACAFVARHFFYKAGWYGRTDTGLLFKQQGTVDFVWGVDTWPGFGQGADIVQRANHPKVVVAGVAADYNDVLTPNFGQLVPA